jgi:hypothetical protein
VHNEIFQLIVYELLDEEHLIDSDEYMVDHHHNALQKKKIFKKKNKINFYLLVPLHEYKILLRLLSLLNYLLQLSPIKMMRFQSGNNNNKT